MLFAELIEDADPGWADLVLREVVGPLKHAAEPPPGRLEKGEHPPVELASLGEGRLDVVGRQFFPPGLRRLPLLRDLLVAVPNLLRFSLPALGRLARGIQNRHPLRAGEKDRLPSVGDGQRWLLQIVDGAAR